MKKIAFLLKLRLNCHAWWVLSLCSITAMRMWIIIVNLALIDRYADTVWHSPTKADTVFLIAPCNDAYHVRIHYVDKGKTVSHQCLWERNISRVFPVNHCGAGRAGEMVEGMNLQMASEDEFTAVLFFVVIDCRCIPKSTEWQNCRLKVSQ